ncbi:MAG: protoporphyrinogen oxidase [Gemmatimonadetes bacterium]|nr:protoporphyrinogen oxidase [Gemmatimonadota bacterium]
MRVGIVGGGITGLALTHALARRGVESVLFEAAARPGGLIRTRADSGRIIELGPQRTRLVPPVRRLISELGLEDRVRLATPGPLHIWARGALRRVPTTPRRLLSGDLLTVPGRLRAALEPLTGPLAAEESVGRYFRRKAGREAYESLFGPLISATFGSDPDQMLAARSLPMILRPLGVRRSLLRAASRWRGDAAASACTFHDGMRELPDALAREHADRIRLATRVIGVERAGADWRLQTRGPVSSEAVRVGRLVVTTPASEAGRLFRSAAPELAARLRGLRYNAVCVVPLEVASTPDGFGFQVAFRAPWRTRGVTWNASIFDRPGLATAYLGGGVDPDLAEWDDDRIGRLVAREYASIHGVEARPLAVARPRLPAWDASWSALDDLPVPDGVHLLANYRSRLGISARIREAETLAEQLASD